MWGDPDSGTEPWELVSEGQVVTGREEQGISKLPPWKTSKLWEKHLRGKYPSGAQV